MPENTVTQLDPRRRRAEPGRPGVPAIQLTGLVKRFAPVTAVDGIDLVVEPRQLADAVRRVHAGLRVVDPALATESLAAGSSPLTEREAQVLRVARDGGTVADLAGALHLSEGTVRNHLSSAIGKTGARTRAEAVRLADEAGWLLG